MYGCARHGMRRMQIGAHALLPVVCDTLFLGRLLYSGDSMPASQRDAQPLCAPYHRISCTAQDRFCDPAALAA